MATTTAATPRIRMKASSRAAALDGGWWPRTADAAAEVPGLVEAVGDHRGTVTHVLLSADQWELPHVRRMAAAGVRVRLGWFTAQPAGLVTMICDFGRDRYDLLVVPAGADADVADRALAAACDDSDLRRADEVLAGARG